MRTHWKAILGVVLIFILGFASGTVGSSIFFHRKLAAFLQHPGAVAEAALEKRLTRHLDLDENQKKQIHAYFLENLQQHKELNKQIQPQMRLANQQTFQEINATLRPDQQERFRQNIEEFRNRFAKVAATGDLENLPPTGSAPPKSNTAPVSQ
jgi:LPS O-antigen subunit length determinant protein (WzzB/FepE family)